MLTKQLPAEVLPVCGDAPAVRRAVANLIANAVRLAPDGTNVTVSADRFDAWNLFPLLMTVPVLRRRTTSGCSNVSGAATARRPVNRAVPVSDSRSFARSSRRTAVGSILPPTSDTGRPSSCGFRESCVAAARSRRLTESVSGASSTRPRCRTPACHGPRNSFEHEGRRGAGGSQTRSTPSNENPWWSAR